MTLRQAISTPEGKRRYVRTLFATIADRYDFITVALSYGQDRRWKRRAEALARSTSPRAPATSHSPSPAGARASSGSTSRCG